MADLAALNALTDYAFPILSAWAFVAARFIGLSLVFPLFSWLNISFTVRFAFAAAMALPLLQLVLDAPQLSSAPAWQLSVLMAKEMLIGTIVGLVAGIPFWLAQSAGEVIDTYRGSSAGNLFDPSLTTETSELGTAFILAALALFVWSGGFTALIAVVMGSYAIWPPFELLPQPSLAQLRAVTAIVGQTMEGALGLASVMLLCLFTAELALGFMSRSARQFQVFELSLAFKNLFFAVLMPLLIAAMLVYIGREVAKLQQLPEWLRMVRG
jgi:type III secretion protein T